MRSLGLTKLDTSSLWKNRFIEKLVDITKFQDLNTLLGDERCSELLYSDRDKDNYKFKEFIDCNFLINNDLLNPNLIKYYYARSIENKDIRKLARDFNRRKNEYKAN